MLDPEVVVWCTYVQCIACLADAAVRYLELGQALKADGAFQLTAAALDYGNADFKVWVPLCTFPTLSSLTLLFRCEDAGVTQSYPEKALVKR